MNDVTKEYYRRVKVASDLFEDGGRCATQVALNLIGSNDQAFGILYVDGEYFEQAKELVASGKAKTVEDILALGVLQLAGS
jgi:hypothetical protein